MTFTPQSPIPPPPEVRGMTEWTPELFSTSALLPRLSVARDQVSKIFSQYLQNIFYHIILPCAAWRGAEVAGLAAGEDPGAEADTGERGSGQEVAHTQPREGEAQN